MTRDAEQNVDDTMGGGAGPGRRGTGRRVRGWVAALALIGLGAVGGALTTIVADADAHQGWRQWMGGSRHHGHGRMTDAAQAIERLQHASAWALGRVDATDEQRERVDAIVASAVQDIFPLRAEHHAHRRDLLAELARPRLDRGALDRIRSAELALAEKATVRLLDATIEIAEVLDTEQRLQLVERFLSHRRRH